MPSRRKVISNATDFTGMISSAKNVDDVIVSKSDYIANVLGTLRKASKFVSYVSTGMLIEFVPSKKGQRSYIDLCSRLVRLESDIDAVIHELEVVDMI